MVEPAACRSTTRGVFGDPFRPAVFVPAWRTSTVPATIRRVYEVRTFSAMPILAEG